MVKLILVNKHGKLNNNVHNTTLLILVWNCKFKSFVYSAYPFWDYKQGVMLCIYVLILFYYRFAIFLRWPVQTIIVVISIILPIFFYDLQNRIEVIMKQKPVQICRALSTKITF